MVELVATELGHDVGALQQVLQALPQPQAVLGLLLIVVLAEHGPVRAAADAELQLVVDVIQLDRLQLPQRDLVLQRLVNNGYELHAEKREALMRHKPRVLGDEAVVYHHVHDPAVLH